MHEEKTILLIEDNPDDIELTLRAFAKSKLKNTVVVVHDGVEALDYLFGTGPYADPIPAHPELILLDLKLSRLDGLEVLRQIRANDATKLLAVVMLTSSLEQEDLVRSYRLGANSYIRKPIDFVQFMTAVQQLGLYWLVLNIPPPRSQWT